jgi:hypothetical protein
MTVQQNLYTPNKVTNWSLDLHIYSLSGHNIERQ